MRERNRDIEEGRQFTVMKEESKGGVWDVRNGIGE